MRMGEHCLHFILGFHDLKALISNIFPPSVKLTATTIMNHDDGAILHETLTVTSIFVQEYLKMCPKSLSIEK